MAFSTSQTTVVELFQAAFNRAPSALAPLDAWVARYDANIASGLSEAVSQTTILNEMMSLGESTGIYGSLSATATVDALFQNSLGRAISSTEAQTIWADYFTANGLALTTYAMLSSARQNADNTTLTNAVAAADAALNGTSTFTVTPDVTSVDEGSTVTFTVVGDSTHASGDTIAYTISGVDASDTASALSGTLTLDGSLTTTVAVVLNNDETTEGSETLTLTLTGDAVSSVTVNDTSLAPTDVLTTSTDSLVGTAGNDIISAPSGTLATADTILDSVTTDADVMNVETTSNGVGTIMPRIQNIETINVNGTYVTTGFDLTSVSGTQTLNLTTGIQGGTATVSQASSLNAATITAGTNVATLVVTATASGTRDSVTVNGGSATSITVTGDAGGDTFTINAGTGATVAMDGKGGVADTYTVNTLGTTATITGNVATEYLTLNNSTGGDTTITVTGAPTTDFTSGTNTYGTTLSGAGNVTLVNSSVNGADFTVKQVLDTTTGGTSTLKFTSAQGGAALDLKAVQVDKVELAHATNVVTNAITVNTGTTVDITGGGSVLLNADDAAGNGAATNTLLLNLSNNTTAVTTGAGVSTALITATPDAVTDTDTDENGSAETQITLGTLTTNAATTTVVLLGTADLEITTLTNQTDGVLSASGLSGNLTVGSTAATGTYVLGNGTNSLTLGNFASTVHGGTGVDTIVGGTTADTINGGGGDDIISDGGTNADTIDAGSGNDTITSTVGSTITLGAGADTIITAKDLGQTVTDFNITEDTIVVTGAATAAVDLTNESQTSGAYEITGATTDFTLTGVTATDISGFVQLGSATTPFVLSTGTTNTLGSKGDHVAVATGTTGTVATGAGADIVELQVVTGGGATTTATVTDFTVGTDKILVTGVGDAATSIDLTATTPTAGAYTLGTTQTAVLSTGGTAFTATDISTMVQLGDKTTAFTAGATSSTITGGVFNDFIAGSTGVDAINFIQGGGMDTITAFKTSGADTLSFDALTGIGAAGATVAANATKLTDAVDGMVYAFDDASDGTGSEAIATFTENTANGVTADVILADVAAFLNAGLGTTTGETYVAVINNTGGTQAYAYSVAGNTAGITATDIALIGAITTNGAIVAADIV